MNRTVHWPEKKKFAFTIIDDTDGATLSSVRPIYEFLHDQGFRTTKTVWPLRPTQTALYGGETLADRPYRDWILSLQDEGCEIAMHGTTDHSSQRDDIKRGFECFSQVLGQDPRLYVNHSGQKESIYWGSDRFDGIPKLLYALSYRIRALLRLLRLKPCPIRAHCGIRCQDCQVCRFRFRGHLTDDPHFWGDLCQERVTYVRNLAFRDVDTLACDPAMPYHDSARPWVPFWFSCTAGADGLSFAKAISEARQDQLLQSGGACIIYTHFARGFSSNGQPAPEWQRLLHRLSRLPGWFVPASTILDHLRAQPGWTPTASSRYLKRLQWRWLQGRLALEGR